MSKTQPTPETDTEQNKPPLQKVVEEMRDKVDDPLRNNVVKTRSLANKTGCESRKVARILTRLVEGRIDGVEIDIWDGKRSDENRLYKIERVKSVPENSLFITEQECAQYRRSLLGTNDALPEMAEEAPHAKSVIRPHIIGKCSHEHTQPAIEYDRTNEVWIPRKE